MWKLPKSDLNVNKRKQETIYSLYIQDTEESKHTKTCAVTHTEDGFRKLLRCHFLLFQNSIPTYSMFCSNSPYIFFAPIPRLALLLFSSQLHGVLSFSNSPSPIFVLALSAQTQDHLQRHIQPLRDCIPQENGLWTITHRVAINGK